MLSVSKNEKRLLAKLMREAIWIHPTIRRRLEELLNTPVFTDPKTAMKVSVCYEKAKRRNKMKR